jgi:hypothetical protein
MCVYIFFSWAISKPIIQTYFFKFHSNPFYSVFCYLQRRLYIKGLHTCIFWHVVPQFINTFNVFICMYQLYLAYTYLDEICLKKVGFFSSSWLWKLPNLSSNGCWKRLFHYITEPLTVVGDNAFPPNTRVVYFNSCTEAVNCPLLICSQDPLEVTLLNNR